MTKENAVLSVDFKKEYSTTEDGVVNHSRVCLSLDAIHSGLIKEVGANRLAILLAIVSHMNEEGKCYPSQERIAQLTGQGRATVQRNLQDLCEAEFNGQKLLHKELVGSGIRKKTVYTIASGLITSTDEDTEQDATEEQILNSRDFVFYFDKKFKEVYGEGHTLHFGKEGAMFKVLLQNYNPDTLKEIVDLVFEEYQNRWYKPQHPHPTVYQLRSWLADQAHKVLVEKKEQEQKQAERQQKAIEQDDTDKALELFDI